MSAAVTLTTDYGLRDGYVGAVRGVLLAAGVTTILDVTHEVPPQDVLAGAVAVLQGTRTFPDGTVHLVVVDPEVGTDRAGVIVRAWGQWYVAPDSGVLHFPLQRHDGVWRIRRSLRIDRGGTTFDGRDWFAPVAAALATGTPVEELGDPYDAYVELSLPDPEFEEFRWRGHVLHVDRFGNLLTDLPGPPRDAYTTARVFLGETPVGAIREAYADVLEGTPVVTVGGLGTIEISVNQGNAARHFDVRRGTPVEVLFTSAVPAPELPW